MSQAGLEDEEQDLCTRTALSMPCPVLAWPQFFISIWQAILRRLAVPSQCPGGSCEQPRWPYIKVFLLLWAWVISAHNFLFSLSSQVTRVWMVLTQPNTGSSRISPRRYGPSGTVPTSPPQPEATHRPGPFFPPSKPCWPKMVLLCCVVTSSLAVLFFSESPCSPCLPQVSL